jgi:hypothetical protein
MGQKLECPLPKKIPKPDHDERIKLTEMGIICLDWSTTRWTFSMTREFVDFQLPQDWTIKKGENMKEEHVEYFIVDNNDFVRVSLSGSWYEYSLSGYHGQVNMFIESGNQKFS